MPLETGLKSANQPKNGLWLAIVMPVVLLSAIGIISLLSAGEIRGNAYGLVIKQLTWLCLAIVACIFTSFVPLNFWKKSAPYIAIITFILLLLVLVPSIGREIKGARRWIDIAGFRIQPSDMAKVAIVIWISAYYQVFQRHIKSFFKGVLIPSALIGIFLYPIAKEPDYGTTAFCGAIAFFLLFMAGTKIQHIAMLVPLGILGLGYMIMNNANRMERLNVFFNREDQSKDGVYQINQAVYSFGEGKWFGVGLGEGRQQYSFLPEAHTDFIFASIAEEWGLIGTLTILALFFIIFIVSFSNLKKAPNMFEYLLCLGAILMMMAQTIFNMGVVTDLLPTKGISLPFLSYGGSNLVVMFFFSGIIINCVRSWNKVKPIKITDYE